MQFWFGIFELCEKKQSDPLHHLWHGLYEQTFLFNVINIWRFRG